MNDCRYVGISDLPEYWSRKEVATSDQPVTLARNEKLDNNGTHLVPFLALVLSLFQFELKNELIGIDPSSNSATSSASSPTPTRPLRNWTVT